MFIEENLSYNPFEYHKRETLSLKNIGRDNLPVVISDLSDKKKIYLTDLKNAGYISLRTGNAFTMYDDIKVWKTRNSTALVTVGAAVANDIRYQNTDPVSSSARIKSLVIDSAGNFSAIATQNINIDWTEPSCPTVNDGTGIDVDTAFSLTTLSANWSSSADANSGIAKYWYAIGTTAGATDVLNWTDNAQDTSVTNSSLLLTNGQTYYFSIKAEDGAGLISICSSDGIFANVNTGFSESENKINISVYLVQEVELSE